MLSSSLPCLLYALPITSSSISFSNYISQRVESSLYSFLQPRIISSLSGPNIPLNTPFSNNFSLCSSLNNRDRVLHPQWIDSFDLIVCTSFRNTEIATHWSRSNCEVYWKKVFGGGLVSCHGHLFVHRQGPTHDWTAKMPSYPANSRKYSWQLDP
jgi:hypothetical protein